MSVVFDYMEKISINFHLFPLATKIQDYSLLKIQTADKINGFEAQKDNQVIIDNEKRK